uniref:C2H2-type domain-containing protein n=1 Tax=Setaria digitata TaxID=48799 RepID=A0A915Q6K9_9BILA
MSSGLRNCSKILKRNDNSSATSTVATTSNTTTAAIVTGNNATSKADSIITSVINEPKKRGRKPALNRSAQIPAVIKESVINGDEHPDDNAARVEMIMEHTKLMTTSVISKANDPNQNQYQKISPISGTASSLTTTTTTASTTVNMIVPSSTTDIMDESELFSPKAYDDIIRPAPSITAMNKSDGSIPLASTDSGIDSCVDVDQEMKDVTIIRDDEEASPSENCSDDVIAVAQSRSSSIHYDRIVCGDCHAEFSLSTFVEFVEHKVIKTLIVHFQINHLII